MNKQLGTLAVALSVAAGTGCSSDRGSSSPSTSTNSPTTMAVLTTTAPESAPEPTFEAAGMHLTIPRRLAHRSDGYDASLISNFGYFSDQQLGATCTSTPTTRTCGPPVASLDPGHVLMTVNVLWMAAPEGEPEIQEPNANIDGQPARITDERPGDCGYVEGATETVNVRLARRDNGRYEIQLCFADPTGDRQSFVDELLASITIDS